MKSKTLQFSYILLVIASVQVYGQSRFTSIAVGYHHGLALRDDGKVFAWGLENDNNGKCVASINGLTGVQVIAAGGYQSCVLRNSTTLLTAGDVGSSDLPAGTVSRIRTLAGTGYADAAILDDSSVVVFGGSEYNYTRIPSGLKAIHLAGAFHSFVAVRKDSTVVAWGQDAGAVAVPTNLGQVVAVASGYHHMLALKKDGTVIAWGENGTSAETAVPSGLVAKAIAASEKFSVAVRTDGTVVVWGSDANSRKAPAGLTDVVAVAAGWSFILALKSNGELVAWGDNSANQCDVPRATGVSINPLQRSDFSLLRNDGMSASAPRVFELHGRATSVGSYQFPQGILSGAQSIRIHSGSQATKTIVRCR